VEVTKIREVVDNYIKITNGELFSIISSYGEVLFFLDLALYLKNYSDSSVISWRDLYSRINCSYYQARSYFETH
jgi:hypothetical protein